MDSLLLGTTNPAKIRELRALLGDYCGRIIVPSEIGIPPDVHETGVTFEENAILKARTYADWSGLLTVADDGGLEIDALSGAPGVRSRRWIDGREASDADLISYALAQMVGVPRDRRGASMKVVEVLCAPSALAMPAADVHREPPDRSHLAFGGEPIVGTGEIRGHIAKTASSTLDPGFPFRSIFVVDRFDKLYVDLTPAEHASVVHRADALIPIRRALGLPDRTPPPPVAANPITRRNG